MSVNIDEGRIRGIFASVSKSTPDRLIWVPQDDRISDVTHHSRGNQNLAIDFAITSSEDDIQQALTGLRELSADGIQDGEIKRFVEANFVSPEVNKWTIGKEIAANSAGIEGARTVTEKEQATLDSLTSELETALGVRANSGSTTASREHH